MKFPSEVFNGLNGARLRVAPQRVFKERSHNVNENDSVSGPCNKQDPGIHLPASARSELMEALMPWRILHIGEAVPSREGLANGAPIKQELHKLATLCQENTFSPGRKHYGLVHNCYRVTHVHACLRYGGDHDDEQHQSP